MTSVREVPEQLREAVLLWKAAGGKEQPPSRWSQTVWQRWLPDHAGYISELPKAMSRAEVAALCADAPTGADQATRAFIAAMIWGYGPVGYGGFRTKRVLAENDGAGETLAAVASVAVDEGGPAAFAWLAHDKHRLRWLGVAFATKYLFFCAAAGRGQPALVLDRLVRNWISNTLNWQLSLEWNVEDYREYVDTVCSWADELGIAPGNLEMVVFQLAANADPQNLWSAPELFASSSGETTTSDLADSADHASLIQVLDDIAAMFVALPGTTDLDDVADFDRGVRNLKRIILARH